jgi:hypothetical protein
VWSPDGKRSPQQHDASGRLPRLPAEERRARHYQRRYRSNGGGWDDPTVSRTSGDGSEAGGEIAKATQLTSGIRRHAWSPDGSKIYFSSTRGRTLFLPERFRFVFRAGGGDISKVGNE